MAETLDSDIPEEVRSWIGQKRYSEESDYCVERGYIMTSCASVANGNPLFWDEATARETTAGWIAPPSMLAVWTRPHYWSPGEAKTNLSLRVHFDVKEQLQLPEGIITGNSIVFGIPARVGDRVRSWQILRSVSELKTVKLGRGRFWEIDVHYENDRGRFLGTESWTCLGYRTDD